MDTWSLTNRAFHNSRPNNIYLSTQRGALIILCSSSWFSFILQLATRLRLGWFPIMHPFHAIFTHFKIAITSLPPSRPSLPSIPPSLLRLPGFTRDNICSVIAQDTLIYVLKLNKHLVTFKFIPLNPPPHQWGRGGGVKKCINFLGSSWNFPYFEILSPKTPTPGWGGG